jgi:endonuclease/exonuclease/phosphatase family metal-dependent hydrolase
LPSLKPEAILSKLPLVSKKLADLNTFTVCSYNVRINVDPKPHDWTSRFPHLLVNLEQIKPSILCLQESSPRVKNDLLHHFPTFEAVGAIRSPGSTEAVHVLFDTRYWKKLKTATYVFNQKGPIICHEEICYAPTVFHNKKDKHTRIFTHIVLENSKKQILHVINTHFSLHHQIQRESAKQLARFIKNKKTVIVTGDLNSHYKPTDPDTPLQKLLNKGKLMDSHALANAPTFGTFQELKSDINKLDYILFKGAISCTDARVSNFTYETNFRPSDHEAIYASFKHS